MNTILKIIAIVVPVIIAFIGATWGIFRFILSQKDKKIKLTKDYQPKLSFSLKKNSVYVSGRIMKLIKNDKIFYSNPDLIMAANIKLENKGKDTAHLISVVYGNKETNAPYLRDEYKANKNMKLFERSSNYFKSIDILDGASIEYKLTSPFAINKSTNEGVIHILFLYENSFGTLYDSYYRIRIPEMPDFIKADSAEELDKHTVKSEKSENFKEFVGESSTMIYTIKMVIDLSDSEENSTYHIYNKKRARKLKNLIKNQTDPKKIQKDKEKLEKSARKMLKKLGEEVDGGKIFFPDSLEDFIKEHPELIKKVDDK